LQGSNPSGLHVSYLSQDYGSRFLFIHRGAKGLCAFPTYHDIAYFYAIPRLVPSALGFYSTVFCMLTFILIVMRWAYDSNPLTHFHLKILEFLQGSALLCYVSGLFPGFSTAVLQTGPPTLCVRLFCLDVLAVLFAIFRIRRFCS
jgi:hypothetical protein